MQIKIVCPKCKKEEVKSLYYYPKMVKNTKTIIDKKYCPNCDILYDFKFNYTLKKSKSTMLK